MEDSSVGLVKGREKRRKIGVFWNGYVGPPFKLSSSAEVDQIFRMRRNLLSTGRHVLIIAKDCGTKNLFLGRLGILADTKRGKEYGKLLPR